MCCSRVAQNLLLGCPRVALELPFYYIKSNSRSTLGQHKSNSWATREQHIGNLEAIVALLSPVLPLRYGAAIQATGEQQLPPSCSRVAQELLSSCSSVALELPFYYRTSNLRATAVQLESNSWATREQLGGNSEAIVALLSPVLPLQVTGEQPLPRS